MTVLGVDHIGMAVRDLDDALAKYGALTGASRVERAIVVDQGVIVAFVTVGNTAIELLEPTSPDTPVGRFLERHGEGFHHIAWTVDDIETELARLKGEGFQLIDEIARRGAHGLVAFVHPRSVAGVLTELVQRDN